MAKDQSAIVIPPVSSVVVQSKIKPPELPK
jgi:hypothetical protein